MYALLQLRGTDPSISDFLQMPAKGGARTRRHFLSRMAGKPSGPAAELIEPKSKFYQSPSKINLQLGNKRLYPMCNTVL